MSIGHSIPERVETGQCETVLETHFKLNLNKNRKIIMGAGASVGKDLIHMTAEDIGDAVASLGEAYAEYREKFVSNGVDGNLLMSLTEADIVSCLSDLSISKVIHQKALTARLMKLKADMTGLASNKDATPTAAVAAVGSAVDLDFAVDSISMTPRSILTELFQIQGIPLDPSDLDPAINKIIQVVGKSAADGINSYDCFINYRVAADADIAEKVYLYLKANGIHAFLDKKCLKDGQDWKSGFIQGEN